MLFAKQKSTWTQILMFKLITICLQGLNVSSTLEL